jgi:acylphosphatase
MKSSFRFVVIGRVQGVSFRYATQNRALSLGLRGWVRNREDGAVEGLICGGNDTALFEFRQWLEQGPPAARVEQVVWIPAPLEMFDDFEIRR